MKSGQGPQRLNLAPPVSPSRFLPQRQEVAALEADDFLWDGHALGLRWLQQQPEQTRTNKSLSHIVKSCTQQCSTFVILSCRVCVCAFMYVCAHVCFDMKAHACICMSARNARRVYFHPACLPANVLAGHLFSKRKLRHVNQLLLCPLNDCGGHWGLRDGFLSVARDLRAHSASLKQCSGQCQN